jgi:integrase
MTDRTNKFAFTNASVKAIPTPTAEEVGKVGFRFYWDTAVDGFGLKVRPSGLKTFCLRYVNKAGRQRLYTIGTLGRFTLEQARDAAKRLNGKVALDGDPAADRKEVRAAQTVDELFERYITEHLEGPECSIYAARSGKRVRKLIKAAMGHKLVTEVDDSDLNVALKPLTKGNYNLVGTYVRAAWDWGRKHRVVPRGAPNPAEFFEPKASTPRARIIHKDEYKKILDAIEWLMTERRNDPARLLACMFVIFTGCRPVEAVRLKKSLVDLKRARAELHEHKMMRRTGRPKVFFLTPEVVAIIKRAYALHTMRGIEDSEYVFPRRGNKQKPSNWLAKTWASVKKRCGLNIDLSQFRSGFINAADEAGLNEEETANTTGHMSLQTVRRHYRVIDQKKAAANAAKITNLIGSVRSDERRPLRGGDAPHAQDGGSLAAVDSVG